MQYLYCTPDGTWGTDNMAIVDCTNWTNRDYELLDICRDSERMDIVVILDAYKRREHMAGFEPIEHYKTMPVYELLDKLIEWVK